MGSRGRMLGQAHWSMPDQYKCVDMKNGIKVLEHNGNNKNQNKLPDISHTKGSGGFYYSPKKGTRIWIKV